MSGKLQILCCLLALSSATWASRFQTRIYEIDPGSAGEAHLIKLTNGRVAFIDANDDEMVESFRSNLSAGAVLELELDADQRIVSAQTMNESEPLAINADHESRKLTYKVQSHAPTVLEGSEQANEIFHRLNPDYDLKSQCYNRAHVWAYEEYQRTGLQTDKAFAFFTNDFIRRTNFWWWFHVAPLLTHRGGAWLDQKVLDHQFTKRPLRIQEWLGQWVKSGPCAVVRKYSDYAEGQKDNRHVDCYVIKTSMYFWQPRDIENFEKTGNLKMEFLPEEIDHAYQEAFYGKRPEDI
jgi:hypothetical protein